MRGHFRIDRGVGRRLARGGDDLPGCARLLHPAVVLASVARSVPFSARRGGAREVGPRRGAGVRGGGKSSVARVGCPRGRAVAARGSARACRRWPRRTGVARWRKKPSRSPTQATTSSSAAAPESISPRCSFEAASGTLAERTLEEGLALLDRKGAKLPASRARQRLASLLEAGDGGARTSPGPADPELSS